MSETLKNTCGEVNLLVNWRFLVKMNLFADIFQMTLLRFKVFAFSMYISRSTYYAGQVLVVASEQELK